MNDECDFCFEYKRCSGEKCTSHTLMDGSILDFARAMEDGRLWGDTIYEEDEELLKSETNDQKHKRLKKKSDDERKAMDKLKETILNKNRFKNCVKVNGKYVLKHKYPKHCENLELKDTTFADGSKYSGGCWAHEEKMCPFLHPDEKDEFDFKGKTKILLVDDKKTHHHRGGKRRTRKLK